MANTVLVIEDEADILRFVSRVLSLEGYHVLRAGSGEEGMRLVRKSQVGLVLLDLKLPGHDGWLVLEEIKRDPTLSAAHVIVFTAIAESWQRDKALRLGAAEYLVKPVSAAKLRETIANVLGEKR